jgi:hypothetical protein
MRFTGGKDKGCPTGNESQATVLDSLEQSLGLKPSPAQAGKVEFDVNEIGFPVYRRQGKGIVTNEFVNQLREQEDI